MPSFFFNDTATTEIYTLSLQTLFRSTNNRNGTKRRHSRSRTKRYPNWLGFYITRSEENTSELQSPCNLLCRLFFLMIRRPPRSTLFPYRRSSDLPTTVTEPNGDTVVLGPSGIQIGSDSISLDRKRTRLNSSHLVISYAVFFF